MHSIPTDKLEFYRDVLFLATLLEWWRASNLFTLKVLYYVIPFLLVFDSLSIFPFTALLVGKIVTFDFTLLYVWIAGEVVNNHDELMSNFFAQPDALAYGKVH